MKIVSCTTIAMIALLVMLISSLAAAQATPPFNNGGVVGYNPEVSVVNSGAILDAQVVVSDDRRYVTLTMRPSLSHLNALDTFPVSGLNTNGGTGVPGGPGMQLQGFVGGGGFIDEHELQPIVTEKVPPGTNTSKTTRIAVSNTSHVKTSPSEILKSTDATAANSFLRKQGMFLLASPSR